LTASSPGFTIRVINARRNPAGKRPVASKRLNSLVINGESRSMTCIRTVVGSGSAAEDLSGSRRTALKTSSVVSLERIKRYAGYCTRLNVGDGTPLVFWRTLVPLSAKNWLKASTSTAELAGTRPRPSKTSTDFQFPHVRLVSFILVAPKLCALSVPRLIVKA